MTLFNRLDFVKYVQYSISHDLEVPEVNKTYNGVRYLELVLNQHCNGVWDRLGSFGGTGLERGQENITCTWLRQYIATLVLVRHCSYLAILLDLSLQTLPLAAKWLNKIHRCTALTNIQP